MAQGEIDPNTGLMQLKPLSQKDFKVPVGNQPIPSMITPVGEYFDRDSRYDKHITNIDQVQNLENFRGEMQSSAAKYALSVPRMLGMAASTFLDATIGLGYGLIEASAIKGAAALAGEDSETFGKLLSTNTVSEALRASQQYFDNEIATIYFRDSYHDKSAGAQLLSPEGFGTAVASGAGTALGFMGSMFIPGAQSKMFTILGKAALNSNKLNQLPKAFKLLEASNPKAVAEMAEKSFKLAEKNKRVAGFMDALVDNARTTAAEAGMETGMAVSEFHDNKKQQLATQMLDSGQYDLNVFEDRFKFEQNLEQLMKDPSIKHQEDELAKTVFRGNMAVIGVTNTLDMVMFHKGFKKAMEQTFKAARPTTKVQGFGKTLWDKKEKIGLDMVSESFQEVSQGAYSEIGMERALAGEERANVLDLPLLFSTIAEGLSSDKEMQQSAILGAVLGGGMATLHLGTEHRSLQSRLKGWDERKPSDIKGVKKMWQKPREASPGLLNMALDYGIVENMNFLDLVKKNEEGKPIIVDGNYTMNPTAISELGKNLATKNEILTSMQEAAKKGNSHEFNRLKRQYDSSLILPFLKLEGGVDIAKEQLKDYYNAQVEQNPDKKSEIQEIQKEVFENIDVTQEAYDKAADFVDTYLTFDKNATSGKGNSNMAFNFNNMVLNHILALQLDLKTYNDESIKSSDIITSFENKYPNVLEKLFNKDGLTTEDISNLQADYQKYLEITKNLSSTVLSEKSSSDLKKQQIILEKQLKPLIDLKVEVLKTGSEKDLNNYLSSKNYEKIANDESETIAKLLSEYSTKEPVQEAYDKYVNDFTEHIEKEFNKNVEDAQKNAANQTAKDNTFNNPVTEDIIENPEDFREDFRENFDENSVAAMRGEVSTEREAFKQSESSSKEETDTGKIIEENTNITEIGNGPLLEVQESSEIPSYIFKSKNPTQVVAYKPEEQKYERNLKTNDISKGTITDVKVDIDFLDETLKKLSTKAELTDFDKLNFVKNLPIGQYIENYKMGTFHDINFFTTNYDKNSIYTKFDHPDGNYIDDLILAIYNNKASYKRILNNITKVVSNNTTSEEFRVFSKYIKEDGSEKVVYTSALENLIKKRVSFIKGWLENNNYSEQYNIIEKRIVEHNKTKNLELVGKNLTDPAVEFAVIKDGQAFTSNDSVIELEKNFSNLNGGLVAVLPTGHITVLKGNGDISIDNKGAFKNILTSFLNKSLQVSDTFELKQELDKLGYSNNISLDDAKLLHKKNPKVMNESIHGYMIGYDNSTKKPYVIIRYGHLATIRITSDTQLDKIIHNDSINGDINAVENITYNELIDRFINSLKNSLPLQSENINEGGIKLPSGVQDGKIVYKNVNYKTYIGENFQTKFTSKVNEQGEHIYSAYTEYLSKKNSPIPEEKITTPVKKVEVKKNVSTKKETKNIEKIEESNEMKEVAPNTVDSDLFTTDSDEIVKFTDNIASEKNSIKVKDIVELENKKQLLNKTISKLPVAERVSFKSQLKKAKSFEELQTIEDKLNNC